jgi:N-acetylmuramoyl-L-alanine amidase
VRTERWAALEGISTAAAIVECGFLTNEKDAHDLAEAGHQDEIAGALAEALREYRDTLAGTDTSQDADDGPPAEGEAP